MAKERLNAQLTLTSDSVRVFFTASQMARQHLIFVQEAGHFKALPGYFTERSGLASYLLVCSVRGRGLLRYEGAESEICAGQAFLIDCRHRQYYRQIGDEAWEIYWVHFSGGAGAAYWRAICESAAGRPGEPISCPDEDDFVRPIRQLMLLGGKPGLQAEAEAARLVTDMLTTLLLAANRLTSQRPAYSPAIQTVADLLQAAPEQHWPLAVLAARVSMNHQYLMRQFRRETGQTPLAFQQALRISRAKTLLRTTNMSVEAIAADCGFDSGNYLIRVFRKLEDSTPAAYRKRWSAGN